MVYSKKLATALQGCRSNAIGKGFLSPPQWRRSKPQPSGRGLKLRAALKGGVSNRSWFLDEALLRRAACPTPVLRSGSRKSFLLDVVQNGVFRECQAASSIRISM